MNDTMNSMDIDKNIKEDEGMFDPFSNTLSLQSISEFEIDLTGRVYTILGITLGLLCLLAHLGITMHRAGITQRKNITTTLMRPLLHLCLVPVLYWLVGYGIFSDGNFFYGDSHFLLSSDEYTHTSKWFVQCCIVMQCVAIASSGGSEYNYITTEALHTVIVTVILFPFPAHWSWSSQGWLQKRGYMDYGGLGPIYLVATSSGLILNILNRKRVEHDRRPIHPRYVDASSRNVGNFDIVRQALLLRSGENVSLATFGGILNILGTIFVQIGMASFHKGQLFLGNESFDILQNCFIGIACGGITTIILSRLITGQWSIYRLYSGMLSSIVMCSGGGYLLHNWQCALLGIFSGFMYILSRNTFLYIGVIDPSDVFSTYGTSSLISLFITPIITMHPRLSGEWYMRLAWNVIGAITMIGWGTIITFLVFILLAKFDLIGQTALFLDGIDRQQMREQMISRLTGIENGFSKLNTKRHHSHACRDFKSPISSPLNGKQFGANGDQAISKSCLHINDKPLPPQFITQTSSDHLIPEKSGDQLRMSPSHHQCISPPRLVSTTSTIPRISNLAQTEADKNVNSTTNMPQTNLLNDIKTSKLQLKDVPLAERYTFPHPPPPPNFPWVSNDMDTMKSLKPSQPGPKNPNRGANSKKEPSKTSLRPRIKLVSGEESDLSSLPRSPFEYIDSPIAPRQRFIPPEINLNEHMYSNPNRTDELKATMPSQNQSVRQSDNTEESSLSHMDVHNQLKNLKPLPFAERRPSLAVRRDVTPVGKQNMYK